MTIKLGQELREYLDGVEALKKDEKIAAENYQKLLNSHIEEEQWFVEQK
jgi:hypothetical protein